jgi:hypothetical protein
MHSRSRVATYVVSLSVSFLSGKRGLRFTSLAANSLCCVVLSGFGAASVASASSASIPSGSDATARHFDLLPLTFEPNEGQTISDAKFVAEGRGLSALFKENEADLLLVARPGGADVLRVMLPNASRNASISPETRLPGTVNYFDGNDPKKWHTGLPTFDRLRYAGVYPGTDLIYYGSQGRLEFDFELSPGAEPKPSECSFRVPKA